MNALWVIPGSDVCHRPMTNIYILSSSRENIVFKRRWVFANIKNNRYIHTYIDRRNE